MILLEKVRIGLSFILHKISLGLCILIVFWLIGIIVEKATVFVGRKSQIHKNILWLLGRIARMALIIIGSISALGARGINILAMVAGLGLTGFALGFALKDVLPNVLSRILVLIYWPFSCSDRIRMTGFKRHVVQIGLRYTTLEAIWKKS